MQPWWCQEEKRTRILNILKLKKNNFKCKSLKKILDFPIQTRQGKK